MAGVLAISVQLSCRDIQVENPECRWKSEVSNINRLLCNGARENHALRLLKPASIWIKWLEACMCWFFTSPSDLVTPKTNVLYLHLFPSLRCPKLGKRELREAAELREAHGDDSTTPSERNRGSILRFFPRSWAALPPSVKSMEPCRLKDPGLPLEYFFRYYWHH